MDRIRLAAPDLGGNEKRYVLDAIRSSWISSTGPYVERFEHEFAQLCGTRAAVSVANGTAALHIAILALGAGNGDEIIVPSLTYIAAANAARYAGARPVFVDVDPETWCISPAGIDAAVTSQTKGIVAVHLYGHPADMDAINAVAAKHGLWVVEDAAEAHFARYKGRPVGGLATIGTFSFYGNKVMTSGEGGAVTTSDPGLERRLRLLRGQGMDPQRRYYFPIVGYNYRLTNVACALLCAQLERRDDLVAKRRNVYERYRAGLEGIRGIGLQPVAAWAEPAPWLYCITVDEAAFGHSRDELMQALDGEGIETRPFFIPMHELPVYRTLDVVHLPVTERLAKAGMNLPTHAALRARDVARIVQAVRKRAATRMGAGVRR